MTPAADWSAQLDQLQDKVDRLLLRHEEARRTQELLRQRVQQLEAERDALRHRLGEARSRVDQLLTRLQGPQDAPDEGAGTRGETTR